MLSADEKGRARRKGKHTVRRILNKGRWIFKAGSDLSLKGSSHFLTASKRPPSTIVSARAVLRILQAISQDRKELRKIVLLTFASNRRLAVTSSICEQLVDLLRSPLRLVQRLEASLNANWRLLRRSSFRDPVFAEITKNQLPRWDCRFSVTQRQTSSS